MLATKTNLLSELNLKSGDFFSPSDMELDSRFELIAEWTDFRFTKSNMLKDIVSEKLVDWTTLHNMRYSWSFTSIIASTFIISPILKFFGVIPDNLPKNYAIAASKIMNAADNLFQIAERNLNNELRLALKYKNTELSNDNPPPSKIKLLQILENQRISEAQRIKNNEDGVTPIYDIFNY